MGTNYRQILQRTVVSKKARSPVFDTLGGQVPWYLCYCFVAMIKYLDKIHLRVCIFRGIIFSEWWGKPDGGKEGMVAGASLSGHSASAFGKQSKGKWSLARKPQGLPQ